MENIRKRLHLGHSEFIHILRGSGTSGLSGANFNYENQLLKYEEREMEWQCLLIFFIVRKCLNEIVKFLTKLTINNV